MFVPLKRYLVGLGRAACAVLPATALAQDADGDGVSDAADAFPCDGARASVTCFRFPGVTSSAMRAFEDRWAGATDLDFDDVVVRAHHRRERAASGAVVSLRAMFAPDAPGGTFSDGPGLQLPVARGGARARRRVGGGAREVLTAEADASATVVLSRDVRALFRGAAGPSLAARLAAVEASAPGRRRARA